MHDWVKFFELWDGTWLCIVPVSLAKKMDFSGIKSQIYNTIKVLSKPFPYTTLCYILRTLSDLILETAQGTRSCCSSLLPDETMKCRFRD